MTIPTPPSAMLSKERLEYLSQFRQTLLPSNVEELFGHIDAQARALSERDEPRVGVSQGCPNCNEIWPARLVEARGEITKLRTAYDRDVQVDRQQYADALQHAADMRATADSFEAQLRERERVIDEVETNYARHVEACASQLAERERELDVAHNQRDSWMAEANTHSQRRADVEREVADVRAALDKMAEAAVGERREVERLREALDILTRACEAGAYVGKTSPAVIQARHHLTRRPAPDEERHDMTNDWRMVNMTWREDD